MASNDSIGKTLTVAATLCIVCSIVVSMSAVLLRPAQEANKSLDEKRNILAAAGLIEEGKTVEEMFEQIETRVINLETGEFTDEVDLEVYDQRKATRDSSLSSSIPADDDIAKINRLEKYSLVYLVYDGDEISSVVLPVRGYGLWSTLYGFVALEADANTIIGLGFYEHAETPGLGGEVDNPNWKALWHGKQVYDNDGDVAIEIIKGNVNPDAADAKFKVDGLSGATLTSRGVSNLLAFWLDDQGFRPFLDKLRDGEV